MRPRSSFFLRVDVARITLEGAEVHAEEIKKGIPKAKISKNLEVPQFLLSGYFSVVAHSESLTDNRPTNSINAFVV
jgi:hypothetical protein